jgi:hypothetical protein
MTPHAERVAREHQVTASRWECVARFIVWGAIILTIIAVCNGCQNTKAYVVALSTYNETLAATIEARKAGEISDKQYRDIETVRKIAADILDQWRESLATGKNGWSLAQLAAAFADAMRAWEGLK